MSPYHTAEAWADLESAVCDLYHNTCHRRNLKIQGSLLARICRLQRKLVASDMLKRGKAVDKLPTLS